MNKFEKCKSCSKYRTCEYIQKGEVCHGQLYSTSYENTFDCIQGKTVEIDLKHEDCDIRLDLIVEKKSVSKLWGQVKDKYGECIEGALVTLLKPQYIRGQLEYCQVSTTISDCMGFYQFETDQCERNLKYRVSVGKS